LYLYLNIITLKKSYQCHSDEMRPTSVEKKKKFQGNWKGPRKK